ncbi:hypothetical protein F5I97DRAFT_1255096 [Phlebopus sp. FC_14]|nr:hypothetical protein F5I97DRAFT_1255096 [Phlebopus sp. FC_14]
MTRAVTATYTLSPPEGVDVPQSLTPIASHSCPVETTKELNGSGSSDATEYYSALRKSIAAAREKLGEELTAWRDAVGNAELAKEKMVKSEQAEEEEEEQEEQEEEYE